MLTNYLAYFLAYLWKNDVAEYLKTNKAHMFALFSKVLKLNVRQSFLWNCWTEYNTCRS